MFFFFSRRSKLNEWDTYERDGLGGGRGYWEDFKEEEKCQEEIQSWNVQF